MAVDYRANIEEKSQLQNERLRSEDFSKMAAQNRATNYNFWSIDIPVGQ
jgi:hypothetical protein